MNKSGHNAGKDTKNIKMFSCITFCVVNTPVAMDEEIMLFGAAPWSQRIMK